MYEVPDDANIKEVIVTEKCILNGEKPEYIYDGARDSKENKDNKKTVKKSA